MTRIGPSRQLLATTMYSLLFFAAAFLLIVCFPFVFYVFGGCLSAPFNGFTFTDREDFYPIGLIATVVSALVLRHLKRPYPAYWSSLAPALLWGFVLAGPAAFWFSLYHMQCYAASVMGHTPRYMIDDPKNILPDDVIYQHLRSGVEYHFAFAGACLYITAAFALHLFISRLSRRTTLALVPILYLLAWCLVILSPQFAWWLD